MRRSLQHGVDSVGVVLIEVRIGVSVDRMSQTSQFIRMSTGLFPKEFETVKGLEQCSTR